MLATVIFSNSQKWHNRIITRHHLIHQGNCAIFCNEFLKVSTISQFEKIMEITSQSRANFLQQIDVTGLVAESDCTVFTVLCN